MHMIFTLSDFFPIVFEHPLATPFSNACGKRLAVLNIRTYHYS